MRTAVLTALAVVTACQTSSAPPGEQLGTFSFHATPGAQACGLQDVPDGGFDFNATFSRLTDGGSAYVSIGGVPHLGTFDGVTIAATYNAQRSFQNCTGCGTTVNETVNVVLLSDSQNNALNGSCPDPGVAPPVDLDAGITPPMSTTTGFDVVRGCGSLVDSVSSDPAPDGADGSDAGCWASCNSCMLNYTLVGERQ